MRRNLAWFCVLALIALLTGPAAVAAGPHALWTDKVDPWVLERLQEEGEASFLLFLHEQADLRPAGDLPTRLEKGAYVYETLTALAARTQGPVIAALEALGVEYRPYWVANMIWVRGDAQAVQSLAGRPEVAHLYANPWVALQEPTRTKREVPEAAAGVEWNIAKVNAPALWALGVDGAGAVIGGQDTGYEWGHPSLKSQYRGWDGSSADHNYHWHDAIHENNPMTPAGNPCGFDSPEPCDDYGHGTHTMGTMVGDDGMGNQIGMAPGARWIGCRNMEQGYGTPATYSECFQWFIAPTDLNGENPDPTMAPHVVNNSWSCPDAEGCTDPAVLQMVVENTRAAGIVVVASAGNGGLGGCSTVSDPPPIYAAAFAVGATDSSDAIAGFSSRGPVTVDGSDRLKPEVVAPGVGVRSSIPGGGYQGGWQGTSMAGPHVAGLAGLLISANPALAGQVDQLESLIERSAVPLTTGESCGGIAGTEVPNNTYGHGRIDALAAHQLLGPLALTKTAGPATVSTGDPLTYTLSVGHTLGYSLTHNLVLTDVIPAGTTFVTATLPHTFDGTTVTWARPDLPVGAGWAVTLRVQVGAPAGAVIANDEYGLRSDEVAPIAGPPVETPVLSGIPYAVLLSPGTSADGLPGGTVAYTHALTNTGGLTDTYTLNAESGLGWPVTAPTSVTLAPGSETAFAVAAQIPPGAAAGTVDEVIVTATSQGDPGVSATAIDTTTVQGHALFLPLTVWRE